MPTETGEFEWSDGVGYDITDETSIMAHFEQAGADDVKAPAASDTSVPVAPVGDTVDTDIPSPASPPVEEPTDLSSFLDEALKDFKEEPKPEGEGEVPPESTEIPEPKNYETLSSDFKSAVGIDIKDALEYAKTFETTAQTALQNIQEAENRLTLRQQEFELTVAWSEDANRLGRKVSEVVQERIALAAQAYSKLPDQQKALVARAGSEGVVALWGHIAQRGAPAPQRSVPQGRADIANPSNDAPSLNDVVALQDDDAYWRAMEQRHLSRRPQ